MSPLLLKKKKRGLDRLPVGLYLERYMKLEELIFQSFDLVTLTVTTVQSAIVFKALIDRALNHTA